MEECKCRYANICAGENSKCIKLERHYKSYYECYLYNMHRIEEIVRRDENESRQQK